jgi:hypothetical protein
MQENLNRVNRQSGSVSVVFAAVFSVLFLLAMVFGAWAFMSRQDYKDNVDKKIADASAVAVQQAESAKDAEFIELEKIPVRNYTGPGTYGSVSFDYPKTWSVYAEEGTSGTVLDLFAFPAVVPGVKQDQTYALRLEIISQNYDTEVKKFDSALKKGEVKATAFRAEKVPGTLGIRVDGAIERNVQGSMVLLPLRDRTIKIYSEIPQFIGDFDTIILPSLTFIP